MKRTSEDVDITWTPYRGQDGVRLVRGVAVTRCGAVVSTSYRVEPYEQDTITSMRLARCAIRVAVRRVELGDGRTVSWSTLSDDCPSQVVVEQPTEESIVQIDQRGGDVSPDEPA